MAEEAPPRKGNRQFSIKRDGALLGLTAVCLYLFISLVTYSPEDEGWVSTARSSFFENAGGPVGAWISDILLHALGVLAYIAPVLAAGRIIMLFRQRENSAQNNAPEVWVRVSGFFLSLFVLAPLLHLSRLSPEGLPAGVGGILGEFLASVFVNLFGLWGSGIFLTLFLCFGMMLFWSFSWLAVFDIVGEFLLKQFALFKEKVANARSGRVPGSRNSEQNIQEATAKITRANRKATEKREPVLGTESIAQAVPVVSPATASADEEKAPEPASPVARAASAVKKKATETVSQIRNKEVKIEPLEKREAKPSERALRDLQGNLFPDGNMLPSIALLDQADNDKHVGYSKERLAELSEMLEQKLADFSIKAEVVAVAPGPVITRFEIQPAPGTKASKVSNIAQDLARSMAMSSVRVVEVIPGKSVMGIEIPNEDRAMVRLASVLAAEEFDKSSSPLTLAIGHDIGGNPVITDLAKMPHLLVAGTTGFW